MTVETLQTGHVVLSPYNESHDAKTVEWLNSPELQKTFGLTRSVSRESHRKWIETAANSLIWAISTDVLGHCGNVLLHRNLHHHSAYFQIYLGESQARGRGIGGSVLGLVLNYAFGPLLLHRVWLHTMPDNKTAENLYRSSGFVEEGLERDVLYRDGLYQSQRRWSLLADEWQARGKGTLR